MNLASIGSKHSINIDKNKYYHEETISLRYQFRPFITVVLFFKLTFKGSLVLVSAQETFRVSAVLY